MARARSSSSSAKAALTAKRAQAAVRQLADPKQAAIASWFFKTGPGQYGEGDRFLGLKVPVTRRVAREFCELPLSEQARLLASPFHEERLLALVILVGQYERGTEAARREIYRFYFEQVPAINNWDLVDLSAPQIVGGHLLQRSRAPLSRLVRSGNLWERRIAIVSTFTFIRHHDHAETLKLAQRLLRDREDLLHKATGWMLREVGKRDELVLRSFLDQHVARMPRTMLRYAIERFPPADRQDYLSRPRNG